MDEVIQILKSTGAIIERSHFVLVSRRHTAVYINKDALYPHTKETSRMCRLFAEKHKDLGIEVVVAPALGGIILSQWTSHHLSELTHREVLALYTEKTPETNQVLSRGYDKMVRGKNVLVVEDIVNTGGSAKKVVNAVRAAGGNVSAVAVIVNRDPDRVTSELFGVPFSSLATLPVEDYDPNSCPLCATNVPVNTSLGYGKGFLEGRHAKL